MSTASLLLAGTLSTVLCYLLIHFGECLPFLKAPSVDRWHTRATPDSGGLAVFAAMAAVYLVFFRGQHTVAAVAAGALWLLGALDDRLQFRARTKFAAQTLVVTLAVAGGVVMQASSWPLINWALSWLWLMGITNAFNLIDNMDGLAAGVTIIIATFRGMALYSQGSIEEALLSGLIAAAFAGFLLFNFKPAKLFMGDGGSMLAGFSLAALTVTGPSPNLVSVMGGLFCPALLFAYPIFDTTLVSILRRAAGRPISVGGRDHSSHRLAAHGVPEALVVTALWAFTALGCATGLLLSRIPSAGPAAVSLLVTFAALFGILLSTLPRAARPRDRHPWWKALRASAAGILDALVTAMTVVAACLLRSGFNLSEAQFGTLLLAVPLVMLVHAAGSAMARARPGPPRWFGFSRLAPLARSVLLTAILARLMLSTGSYPRGVALAYPLLAFVLGLSLASRPWWRRARARLRAPAPEPAGCPVTIYGTGAESRALARFLSDSSTYGMRPVAFLQHQPELSEGCIEGLPAATLERDLGRLKDHWKVTRVLLPAGALMPEDSAVVRHLLQQASLQVGTFSFHALTWGDAPAAVEESMAVLA